MSASTEFMLGMLVAFVIVVVLSALVKRTAKDCGGEDWRTRCSQEQHRGDQWRALFERQRFIDDHSPAAARQEQFDVDRRARALGLEIKETRRTQP